MWIEKSTSASREAKRSLVSTSGEAHMVSGCETTLAFHRAQSRFSREAKGKALISAITEVVVASLSVAEALSSEPRIEAPFNANSEATSVKIKAILNSTKELSAKIASPYDEAILTSHPTRRSSSKAKSRVKPKTFHPFMANFQPPRSPCWIDWVRLT